jgi:phospholipase C
LPTSSTGQPDPFDGLNDKLFNPAQTDYFQGKSTTTLPIFPSANATDMPNPDPKEDYLNVNYQLFGAESPSRNPTWKNLGFVINYQTATGANSQAQIMEPFSPEQVPVISTLAKSKMVLFSPHRDLAKSILCARWNLEWQCDQRKSAESV